MRPALVANDVGEQSKPGEKRTGVEVRRKEEEGPDERTAAYLVDEQDHGADQGECEDDRRVVAEVPPDATGPVQPACRPPRRCPGGNALPPIPVGP